MAAHVPESVELLQETAERRAWGVKLRVFWDADASTTGWDFRNPTHLSEWVLRRVVAAAGRPGGALADADLRTIAEGVSVLTGREWAERCGLHLASGL